MSEIFINNAKTCAVTGNRILGKDIDVNNITNIFEQLIIKGFDTFLIGMAIGFDTLCFNILLELKTKYNIKIYACIPCAHQDINFTVNQKKEYNKLLSLADEKIYVGKQYTTNCMMKRNKFMVDNSSVLLCYQRKISGGTKNTKDYAIKNNKIIIDI